MSSRKAKRGLTSRQASTQANEPGKEDFPSLREPQATDNEVAMTEVSRIERAFSAEEAAMWMLNGGFDAASTAGWVVKPCGCKYPVAYLVFDAQYDLEHITEVVAQAMVEGIHQVRSLGLAECISPTCTADPPHRLPS